MRSLLSKRERERERETDRETERQRQRQRQTDRQTDRERRNEGTIFFINEGNGISTILFYIQASGKKVNKKNRKQNINSESKKSY